MIEQETNSNLCMRFGGKTALVTGGSRGIGRATVLGLAQGGARVIAVYRTESAEAASLRQTLAETGAEHLALAADITQPAEVERMMDQVRAHFGSLDILINCAGASGRAMIPDMSEEEWARLIASDLTSVFRMTRAALAMMNDGGSIVTISGQVAAVGQPGLSHYAAAKGGANAFMRSLAKEVGGRGIRANVVSSGIVNTDRLKRLPPEAQQRYAKMSALGRVAEPEDIANAALFLASDLAGFVTGAVLTVDGGS